MINTENDTIQIPSSYDGLRILKVDPIAEFLASELGAVRTRNLNPETPLWYAPDGSKISAMLDARLLGRPIPDYGLSLAHVDEAMSWRSEQDDKGRLSDMMTKSLSEATPRFKIERQDQRFESLLPPVECPDDLREVVCNYSLTLESVGHPTLSFKINALGELIGTEWTPGEDGAYVYHPRVEDRVKIECGEIARLFDANRVLAFDRVYEIYKSAKAFAESTEAAFHETAKKITDQIGVAEGLYQFQIIRPNSKGALFSCVPRPGQKAANSPKDIADAMDAYEAGLLATGHLTQPLDPRKHDAPPALVEAAAYWKKYNALCEQNDLSRLEADWSWAVSNLGLIEKALMVAPARTDKDVACKAALLADYLHTNEGFEDHTIAAASSWRFLQNKVSANGLTEDFGRCRAAYAIATAELRLHETRFVPDDASPESVAYDEAITAELADLQCAAAKKVLTTSASSTGDLVAKMRIYLAETDPRNSGARWLNEARKAIGDDIDRIFGPRRADTFDEAA